MLSSASGRPTALSDDNVSLAAAGIQSGDRLRAQVNADEVQRPAVAGAEDEPALASVYVRTLAGRLDRILLAADKPTSEVLLDAVAAATGIPRAAFYLTLNGRVVQGLDFPPPCSATLVMCGRLRGGMDSPPPASPSSGCACAAPSTGSAASTADSPLNPIRLEAALSSRPDDEAPPASGSVSTRPWQVRLRLLSGQTAVVTALGSQCRAIYQAARRHGDVPAAFGLRTGPAGRCPCAFVPDTAAPVSEYDVQAMDTLFVREVPLIAMDDAGGDTDLDTPSVVEDESPAPGPARHVGDALPAPLPPLSTSAAIADNILDAGAVRAPMATGYTDTLLSGPDLIANGLRPDSDLAYDGSGGEAPLRPPEAPPQPAGTGNVGAGTDAGPAAGSAGDEPASRDASASPPADVGSAHAHPHEHAPPRDWECAICTEAEPLEEAVQIRAGQCRHWFHARCLARAVEHRNPQGTAEFACPLCRLPVGCAWDELCVHDRHGRPAPRPMLDTDACLLCGDIPVGDMRHVTGCGHLYCRLCFDQHRDGQLTSRYRDPATRPRFINRPVTCPHCRALVEGGPERPDLERPGDDLAPSDVWIRDSDSDLDEVELSDIDHSARPAAAAGAPADQGPTAAPAPADQERDLMAQPTPARLDIRVPPTGHMDGGVPLSLPPAECFAELCNELGPCMVGYTDCAPDGRTAALYQGRTPWMVCGRRDAHALGEALALLSGGLGATHGVDPPSACRECGCCLAGHQVVGELGGAVYHERCWHDLRRPTAGLVTWHGLWGSSSEGSRGDDDDAPATVLLLGHNGSTAQAILQDVHTRGLRVRLVFCVSAAVDRLDSGHSELALIGAGEMAFGSRLMAAASCVSWASAPYREKPHQPRRRRLLLLEVFTCRPRVPHAAPLLATPRWRGSNDTLTCLIAEGDAPLVRDALERIRGRASTRLTYSCQEARYTIDDARLDRERPAVNWVQFVMARTDDSGPELDEVRGEVLQRAQSDLGPFWTDGSVDAAADRVLLPIARPHFAWVITELAQGIRAGFPQFRLTAAAAGLAISGISDTLLPGLLRAAGFGPDRRDLDVAFRPGLSLPIRIASHGDDSDPLAQLFRISPALTDTDHTAVLARADLPLQDVRAAVSAAVGHTVTISRVRAMLADGEFHEAWHIRVPGPAGTGFRRWADSGYRLVIRGVRTAACAATLVQAAANTGGAEAQVRLQRAATAQRGWGAGNGAPERHGNFISTRMTGGSRPPETLQMSQASGHQGLRLEAIASARLHGVAAEVVLATPPLAEPSPDRAAEWAADGLGRPIDAARVQEQTGLLVGVQGRIGGDEGVVLRLRANTELTIRTASHVSTLFCPSDRLAFIFLDAAAARRAGRAGWDDTVEVQADIPPTYLFRIHRPDWRPMSPPPPAAEPFVAPPATAQADAGGPTWVPPQTVAEWMEANLTTDAPLAADAIAALDDEARLGFDILLTYTPRPRLDLSRQLGDWLRVHIGTLAPGRAVYDWLWPWLLYLWSLQAAGFDRLARTDLIRYDDFVQQIAPPSWAGDSLPFLRWARGLPSMTPGHKYAGLWRADPVDRNRVLVCSPPLAENVLARLGTMVEYTRTPPDAPMPPAAGDDADADAARAEDPAAEAPGATGPAPPPATGTPAPAAGTGNGVLVSVGGTRRAVPQGGGATRRRRLTTEGDSAPIATRRRRAPATSLEVVHSNVIANTTTRPLTAETVLLDPAGQQYVHGAFRGAGGASGTIYGAMGFTEDRLPAEVRSSLNQTGDAVCHRYPAFHVLHVLGPNFAQGTWTEGTAIEALQRAYSSALGAYARLPNPGPLRLVPIAGGNFAGSFGSVMPQLTAQALIASMRHLDATRPGWYPHGLLQMFVRVTTQAPLYRRALADPTRPPPLPRPPARAPRRPRGGDLYHLSGRHAPSCNKGRHRHDPTAPVPGPHRSTDTRTRPPTLAGRSSRAGRPGLRGLLGVPAVGGPWVCSAPRPGQDCVRFASLDAARPGRPTPSRGCLVARRERALRHRATAAPSVPGLAQP